MTQISIQRGSRVVIATRNDAHSKWSARLYVNRGETATQIAAKHKTEAGLRRWADRVLGA